MKFERFGVLFGTFCLFLLLFGVLLTQTTAQDSPSTCTYECDLYTRTSDLETYEVFYHGERGTAPYQVTIVPGVTITPRGTAPYQVTIVPGVSPTPSPTRDLTPDAYPQIPHTPTQEFAPFLTGRVVASRLYYRDEPNGTRLGSFTYNTEILLDASSCDVYGVYEWCELIDGNWVATKYIVGGKTLRTYVDIATSP